MPINTVSDNVYSMLSFASTFICRGKVCAILLIRGLDVYFCFAIVYIHVQFFMYRTCLIWFSYTLFQEMACLNSVVSASDEQLVNVHLEFQKWKQMWQKKQPTYAKTDFGWALRHYDRCVCR